MNPFDKVVANLTRETVEQEQEIESLRQQLAEAQAEIEKLRRLNSTLVDTHNRAVVYSARQDEQVTRQAATIWQMRDALEAVATLTDGEEWRIAQDALAITDDSDQPLREFAAKVREQCANAASSAASCFSAREARIKELCVAAIRSGEMDLATGQLNHIFADALAPFAPKK